jgi:putative transcriptional regulator
MTDINSLLFKIEMSQKIPYQGALLISEPFLREEYFCHSVICIVEYDAGESTMGIIMNKRTEYSLNDLVSQINTNINIPVFCGGPLSCDRLYFIHTLGDIIPQAKRITDGLYIGGDFDTIIDYINSGYPIDNNIRFFLGYSGWDPGQLEDELKHHVWAVSESTCNKALLQGSGDKYWHQYVKSLGKEYRGWLYHPENPQMN